MLSVARRSAALIALCLVLGVPARALAGPVAEYRVKAAFLFNFPRFVSWPPQAFASAGAPIVIAVLGRDPFGPDLADIVSGRDVDGRSLLVRRYESVSQIGGCDILFIARSETARLPQILSALRGRSILTVSDIDGSARSGVMIDLVTRRNRIRMHVNVAVARQSGLGISSQLLRLARIVGPRPD